MVSFPKALLNRDRRERNESAEGAVGGSGRGIERNRGDLEQ